MTSITKIWVVTIISMFISFPVNSSIIMHDENEVTAYFSTELKRLGSNLFGSEDLAVGKSSTSSQLSDIINQWSFSSGERVKSYDPTKHKENPEELGSYVEGDLLLPTKLGRNGLADITTRWPAGVIPYKIEATFTANDLKIFEKALQAYHTKTCIRFKPYTTEKDYIAITNNNAGCYSAVGRIGGRQVVNLQTPGCMTKVGTPIHEVILSSGVRVLIKSGSCLSRLPVDACRWILP
jgi:hypothetical protein